MTKKPAKPASVFKPAKSKYWVIGFNSFKKILLISLSLGLFAGLAFLVTSDFFNIRTVNCFKNKFPCSQDELTQLDFFKGQNIFFIQPASQLKIFLDSNPQIKNITVKKSLPNKIEVDLTTREPTFAVSLKGDSWFLTDEQGVIIDEVDSPLNLPKIFFSQGYELTKGIKLDSDFSQKAFLLAKTLRLFFVSFDWIRAEFPDQLILQTDGTTAVISAHKNIKFQVTSLQLILSRSRIEGRNPVKIDFRFEKPVISF